MSDKVVTFTYANWNGKEQLRQVNTMIDVGHYKGTPGHALLIIAANTHLAVSDIRRLLEAEGIERSRSWIQRRRWLFSNPDAVNAPGTKPNADGLDNRAVQIMRDNRTLSIRQLSRLLKEHGIGRGRDWVMLNRCR